MNLVDLAVKMFGARVVVADPLSEHLENPPLMPTNVDPRMDPNDPAAWDAPVPAVQMSLPQIAEAKPLANRCGSQK